MLTIIIGYILTACAIISLPFLWIKIIEYADNTRDYNLGVIAIFSLWFIIPIVILIMYIFETIAL